MKSNDNVIFHVSHRYAPRWDCGSQYELEVQLLDKEKKVVDTFSYGPAVTPQWNVSQWKQVRNCKICACFILPLWERSGAFNLLLKQFQTVHVLVHVF